MILREPTRAQLASLDHARRRVYHRAVEEAMARHRRPEIANADQGVRSTSSAFRDAPPGADPDQHGRTRTLAVLVLTVAPWGPGKPCSRAQVQTFSVSHCPQLLHDLAPQREGRGDHLSTVDN